jgi:hypothetical protein
MNINKYKTHYMPKNTIYQIVQPNIEKDMRNSYTGGSVDVYIPHNRIYSFISFNDINGVIKQLYLKIICYYYHYH